MVTPSKIGLPCPAGVTAMFPNAVESAWNADATPGIRSSAVRLLPFEVRPAKAPLNSPTYPWWVAAAQVLHSTFGVGGGLQRGKKLAPERMLYLAAPVPNNSIERKDRQPAGWVGEPAESLLVLVVVPCPKPGSACLSSRCASSCIRR